MRNQLHFGGSLGERISNLQVKTDEEQSKTSERVFLPHEDSPEHHGSLLNTLFTPNSTLDNLQVNYTVEDHQVGTDLVPYWTISTIRDTTLHPVLVITKAHGPSNNRIETSWYITLSLVKAVQSDLPLAGRSIFDVATDNDLRPGYFMALNHYPYPPVPRRPARRGL